MRRRRRPEVTFCSGRRSGAVCQVAFVSRERENLHFGVVSRTFEQKMSAPASDGKPKAMEWTEDHDVILLRDILASDLFSFEKGCVTRGERSESITEKLKQVKTLFSSQR